MGHRSLGPSGLGNLLAFDLNLFPMHKTAVVLPGMIILAKWAAHAHKMVNRLTQRPRHFPGDAHAFCAAPRPDHRHPACAHGAAGLG